VNEPLLPTDPDVETDVDQDTQARPAHLSASNFAIVVAGGTAGTGLRYLIDTLIPSWHGLPVATVGINVVGAFLLGVLLETLALRDPSRSSSRQVRLGVGTGVLGGFTTYSALATHTTILAASRPGAAAGYALATVIIGAAASIFGIWVGRRGRRRPVGIPL
jgi:CrcB protein